MRISGCGTNSGSTSIAGRFEANKSSKSVVKDMENGEVMNKDKGGRVQCTFSETYQQTESEGAGSVGK